MAGYPIAAAELAMLPSFCHAMSPGNYEPNARELAAQGAVNAPDLGLPHMQHFCHGLKSENRAARAIGDPKVRGFELHNAVGEFQYVIEATPLDEHTRPYVAEATFRLGKAYQGLGKNDSALAELTKAIELKNDLVPAYVSLVDLLRSMGNAKEAKRVLEKGLEVAPQSKALKRRQKELNAK